ncbi:glycosyltransferase [Aureivirga sp. CE67]|uniref:glycosyltransferase n=1 Tax=Aureivirga sp. CE67 TaxID=1788983 RepID=UPI0018C9DD0B|nr:glycosyltransferase [Aureivirga sp. CE67]
MKKVVISVINDLATDQRVEKVSNTLFQNNYEVLLIGRKLPNSLPINRNYKTHRMKLIFNSGKLFYLEYNFRLFFFLLFTKKDILLSNDLDTLLGNYYAGKLTNTPLVYDSHELFTEVPELIHRPKTQAIWERLENKLLPKIKHCYTVCDSIATFYNKKYSTNFKVIKNVPVLNPNFEEYSEKDIPFSSKKVLIYQGAVNVGRGIELMIDSMKFLPEDYQLLIVGDGDIFDAIKERVSEKKLENKILILGRISPKKLKSITKKAHLGFSLEEELGLSYKFALPNKLFDYIHAEIPALVSNLPEMSNIVTKYQIGKVVKNRDPKAIAEQIMSFETKSYSKQLKNAKQDLNWNHESTKLLTIFNEI